MKVLIIGGGATGLSAAYELQKEGHEVVIVERSDNVGGLAGSLTVQGTNLELFYHHLFTTDTAAIDLIKEIGLGEKLKFYPSNNGIFYDEKLYPFSSPADMLKFPPVTFIDRVRFGVASAYLKLLPNGRSLEKQLALDWLNKWSGKRITEVIWKPLMVGKFGDKAKDIAMVWMWARIHNRSFKLGYMNGGFQQVYEVLSEKILEKGGTIHLSESVDSLKSGKNGVKAKLGNGKTIEADTALVTVPEPIFAKMSGQKLDPKKSHAHLGATCFVLELDRSLVPYYWVNINDTTFPFLAVVEHTKMVGTEAYKGKHIVYVGNYVPHDDWRFTSDPNELLEKYIPYLQRLNPDFKKSWIKKWHFNKAPFTQPIVNREYAAKIPPHRTALPNVWLATMAQIYPEDRGQNYAFAMAKKVVRDMLNDR